jgi:uncharacterized protein (DUF1330 family)
MKAYAIGSVQMGNDSWVKDYAAKTEAIVARHGGRYLVRGATMEKLEGAGPLPHVSISRRINPWSMSSSPFIGFEECT